MAAANGTRKWGTTSPISEALPTEVELRLNEALISELRAQNNFETAEDTEKRKTALAIMQKVTVEFVRHVGRRKGLAASVIENAGGVVATFGSYRLGVYGPGSDIDTLVVAPKHVTREDFFEDFPPTLEKMSAPGAIEELTRVPDAHVPIIKLEYSGISIDLIFTRLAIPSVPENIDLKNTSLLRGLDETDLRSINGTRVADEMLSLVPQPKSFRHALRAIKLWAQRRAIYANVVGFPGGVAWALLVARICQLYPMACGATIVQKFFFIMRDWHWPRPVMLKTIEDGPLQVRTWNPQIYPGDRRHLMPIITPAYPSMCATHNITHSTKEVIAREISRANNIATDIAMAKKPWKELFVKHNFFCEGYKYYLSIISGSRTKDAQQIWEGLVQSKVRRLVSGIEMSETGVKLAHPFTKGFDRVHKCKSEDEVDKIFQGDLSFQVGETELTTNENGGIGDEGFSKIEASGVNNDENQPLTIYTTTFYVGLELGVQEGRKLDITNPVAEFKRQCTEWALYNPELNSLRTVHTRNYDLPADVFEPGEKRPEKAKSKKRGLAKAMPQATAQTTLTEASSLPDSTPASKKQKSESSLLHESVNKSVPNLNELVRSTTPGTMATKRSCEEEEPEVAGSRKRQQSSTSVVNSTPAG